MAEKKKYDSDIVGWYTRGGKRIPIREKKADREKRHEGLKNVWGDELYNEVFPEGSKPKKKGSGGPRSSQQKDSHAGSYAEGGKVHLGEHWLDKKANMTMHEQEGEIVKVHDDGEMTIRYKTADGTQEEQRVGMKWFDNHFPQKKKKK